MYVSGLSHKNTAMPAGWQDSPARGNKRENQMSRRILSSVSLAALVMATPAYAVDVKKSVDVSANAGAVWKAIGDFCGIGKWHPAVEKCTISKKGGDTYRTLALKGGGEVYEKQAAWDDKAHSYSYTIESSPLPVADYKATISVAGKGSGSTISWTASFRAKGATDDKAAEVIGGVFDGGLGGLKAQLK
jgi:hypothetical protein